MSLYLGEQKIPFVLTGNPVFECGYDTSTSYNSTCNSTASITLPEAPKSFKFYAIKKGYSQSSISTSSGWVSIFFGGWGSLNASALLPVTPTITNEGKTFSCSYNFTPAAGKYAIVGVFILMIYIP